MRKETRRFALGLAALALSAILAPEAMGDDPGAISIDRPWARATAPGAPNGAVFMTIVNRGAEDDRLIAADADVAKVIELHTHRMDGGVMRMRQVPEIPVAGGSSTNLAPGGYHVMLIGLNAPLTEGTSFSLALTLERAGAIRIEVPVAAPGAMAGPDAGAHSHPMGEQ